MVLREPCISGNQIQDVIMQRMFSSPINHFLGPEFRSYAKRACLHARTHAHTELSALEILLLIVSQAGWLTWKGLKILCSLSLAVL